MPTSIEAGQFIERLEAHRSPEQAEGYRRTFQAGAGGYGEGDLFWGVRMGQVFALAGEFVAMPPGEIERLLDSPIHEVRVGALSIMDKQGRSNGTPPSRRQELYALYLRRHDRINNWDLVDLGAPFVVGRYLFDKPRDPLHALARSGNVWERRTAIVSTAYFIRQGDVADTFALAEVLLGDPHDLIQKAVGGWVREAGKRDRPRLLAFLDRHAATMPRTSLRYAIEHLDPGRRGHYLGLQRARRRAADAPPTMAGTGIGEASPSRRAAMRKEHRGMTDHETRAGAGANAAAPSACPTGPTAGPLAVSRANPRYFTNGSGDGADRPAVYLTGSHIWNNFHDGMGPGSDCAEPPERLDYDAYLAFLADHGHNFIRLWRWEHFKSQAAGGGYHLCMTPQPWPRTGPGAATDGQPRFDLSRFDPAYFARLRARVVAAGDRGIYVAVMLFDGFALHLSPAPDHVAGHPFHAANNVNGVGIASIAEYQVLPLDPRVQALQEAYIRRVVDTVHDLPNVLYEVANESAGGGRVDRAFAAALGLADAPHWGDSTAWQYWVIDVVKRHEREMGYNLHPVGMTMQFPVADQTQVNAPLFDGPADWVSPGYDDAAFAGGRHPGEPGGPQSRWYDDPPAADGRKVVLSDTDHYAAGRGDALWAWKTFLRGHQPLLMDFGLIEGVHPPDPTAGATPYASFEPARYAMGDTRRYAERMGLVAMAPRGELSSTGYALAHPGAEYLVLQPDDPAAPFSVTLEADTYAVEWYNVTSRETQDGGELTVASPGAVRFTAPFAPAGPAVLYLRRVGR